MSSRSKTRRTTHATKVAARSANASGVINCYVEAFEHSDGTPDLRLREKKTGRRVRVMSTDPHFRYLPPLANLLQDCHGHGGGLTDQWSRKETIAVNAPVATQDTKQVAVWLDGEFSLKVHIATAETANPPVSVWCYIEEYGADTSDTLGLRLREKGTGRKVEMFGKNKEHLTKFLASPRFTGAESVMPNLYEQEGFADYVMVSGGTAVDSFDVLLFQDNDDLTYLLGPSPDTAYRDAFRGLDTESAADSHARTARNHFDKGHYREAILAARLAVETRCGGGGKIVKNRLAEAPQDVQEAGDALFSFRNIAVHEGGTRIEQPDTKHALQAMATVLDYVASTTG